MYYPDKVSSDPSLPSKLFGGMIECVRDVIPSHFNYGIGLDILSASDSLNAEHSVRNQFATACLYSRTLVIRCQNIAKGGHKWG